MTDPREFNESQRKALEDRQADQDRTLAAIQQLERAMEMAAPGRESAWRDEMLAALAILDMATAEEDRNAARIDSLLSDINRTQPRLRNRVRGVRLQYGHLRDRIAGLRSEMGEDPDSPTDFADVRQRLTSLLAALRHQRARESDLLYEAYYDAFNADLRAGG
jgi:chromosome segregation ATPase